MFFYQPVPGRHCAFEAVEGNHSCSHGHFFQLFLQGTVVMVVQIWRTNYLVINFAGIEKVLIKGVIKVEMVKSLKRQRDKVPVQEVCVLQTQYLTGSFCVN